MRRRHIHLISVTAARPGAVFALLADGASWPRWSPIESFELDQAGDPPPEGVGAVRLFRRGRTTGRDRVLELVPGRRFVYSSAVKLPLRNYVGEVDLEPTANGSTAIRWHSSFDPTRPGTGWLLERGLRRFLTECLQGLVEYSTTVSDATTA